MDQLSNATSPLLKSPVANNINDIENNDDEEVVTVTRATLSDMMDSGFYKRERWFDELCEGLFKIQRRKTTVTLEIYYGLVHYVSCLFCLAVIPAQMSQAGYNKQGVFVSTAICCGVGSIICGLFANLPFVIAPPAAVAIFLSVYLQNFEDKVGLENLPKVGSAAVMFSGVLLMFLGFRPLGTFISRLIPRSIQAGTAVGIGLVTALAGAVDIDLVVEGRFNVLLRMGVVNAAVLIAFGGVALICIATHYHMKGAFCIAIIAYSLCWGIYSGEWPEAVVSIPSTNIYGLTNMKDSRIPVLVADLLFLYILYLNGLIASLSLIANLNRNDGSTPRGRWIFILTGGMTLLSGYLTGAPVLISPESAAGIKDGAKTGLSALTCGILFLLSVFFSPLFDAIPKAGTSPILLMIGALLFQNTVRIDWTNITKATPAFIVLFFIPFTYSVIQGVLLGYSMYIIIGLFTGELYYNAVWMLQIYFPENFPVSDEAEEHAVYDRDQYDKTGKVYDKNITIVADDSRSGSRSRSLSTQRAHILQQAANEFLLSGVHSTDELTFASPVERDGVARANSRRMTVDCLVYSPDELAALVDTDVDKRQGGKDSSRIRSNSTNQRSISIPTASNRFALASVEETVASTDLYQGIDEESKAEKKSSKDS